MAYVGLSKPVMAKKGTDGYTDGFVCGKAIAIDITPQYAEGSLYADNGVDESDKEFISATISLETNTLPSNAHSVLFGNTHAQKTETEPEQITEKGGDMQNEVGFGVVIGEKVNGAKKYVAMWMPRCKFATDAESYKTKGENIEYQTPKVSGKAYADQTTDEWRVRTIHDTEAAAYSWLKGKAGIAAAGEA